MQLSRNQGELLLPLTINEYMGLDTGSKTK